MMWLKAMNLAWACQLHLFWLSWINPYSIRFFFHQKIRMWASWLAKQEFALTKENQLHILWFLTHEGPPFPYPVKKRAKTFYLAVCCTYKQISQNITQSNINLFSSKNVNASWSTVLCLDQNIEATSWSWALYWDYHRAFLHQPIFPNGHLYLFWWYNCFLLFWQ